LVGTNSGLLNSDATEYTLNVSSVATIGGTGGWTKASPVALQRFAMAACTMNSRMYVAAGSNTVTCSNDVWSSTGNGTWVQVTAAAAFSVRYYAAMVNATSTLVLVGGYDDRQTLNDVWRSSDGSHWLLFTARAPFAARSCFSMLVFKGSIVIAAGFSGDTGSMNDVWAFTIDAAPFRQCTCVAGYDGANCSTNTQACLSSPCRNGGTCQVTVDSYQCHCATGHQGVNCTTNIDDCTASPCKNGGTCFDGTGSYVCRCITGYVGPNCTVNSDSHTN
jgi:hypothetical protein